MKIQKYVFRSATRIVQKRASLLLASFLAVFVCLTAGGQTSTGRILGTVTDATGASVAGASVTVTDLQRGTTRSLRTTQAGEYVAPNLTPGTYKVRVEFKGFKSTERTDIQVDVASDAQIDITLQTGQTTETVVVTTEAPLIDTTSSTLGGTLSNEEINDLPLNGRNYENLLQLRPGVVRYPGGGFSTTSTNGLRAEDNAYIVDGLFNSEPFSGQSIINGAGIAGDSATILPVDAIQEFNLIENPPAEYGWKPGAMVNVALKSGTNALHGTAYAYGRDTPMDARNYFNTVATGVKNPRNLEQFGATAGGPIRKDHLFFFVLIGGHADKGLLSGGGSAQVDPPGGSVIPPPPAKTMMEAFMRPAWLPGSPLKALSAQLPQVKVTYESGDDLAAAAAAAKQADVAIVFAYQWESEGLDLPSLDLADNQNKLIETVAAANPKTVVVLETGSPTTMSWIDKVAGVVEAWYPGIRGAEALANLLTGEVNPSAKLAITFPRSDADLPHPAIAMPPPASDLNFADMGGDISGFMSKMAKGLPPFETYYDEKLKVGYAWYDAEKKPVLFPFGFGLSYTSYAYSGLAVKGGDNMTVLFTVKNTGTRAGTEIAEVYASLPDAAGEPPKRLIGWARVELAAGESKPVTIKIPHDRLTVYDEASDGWKLTSGSYTVLAGGSSRDLPLRGQFTLP